jgi:hypothetical protein
VQIKQFYNPRGGDDGNPTSVVASPPTPGNNMPTDTKYDYKPGEQQVRHFHPAASIWI